MAENLRKEKLTGRCLVGVIGLGIVAVTVFNIYNVINNYINSSSQVRRENYSSSDVKERNHESTVEKYSSSSDYRNNLGK